jgi:hypothetical protein
MDIEVFHLISAFEVFAVYNGKASLLFPFWPIWIQLISSQTLCWRYILLLCSHTWLCLLSASLHRRMFLKLLVHNKGITSVCSFQKLPQLQGRSGTAMLTTFVFAAQNKTLHLITMPGLAGTSCHVMSCHVMFYWTRSCSRCYSIGTVDVTQSDR